MKATINRIISKKPCVVFLHGFTKTGDDWNISNIEKQISKTYQTINFTFTNEDYLLSFEETCNNIVKTIGESKLNIVWIIVGHSIGGLYAQMLAKLYPKNIKGLVLVSSSINTKHFYERMLKLSGEEKDETKKKIYKNWFDNIPKLLYPKDLNHNIKIICHVDIKNNNSDKRELYEYYKHLTNKNAESKILLYIDGSHMIHHKSPYAIVSSIKELIKN